MNLTGKMGLLTLMGRDQLDPFTKEICWNDRNTLAIVLQVLQNRVSLAECRYWLWNSLLYSNKKQEAETNNLITDSQALNWNYVFWLSRCQKSESLTRVSPNDFSHLHILSFTCVSSNSIVSLWYGLLNVWLHPVVIAVLYCYSCTWCGETMLSPLVGSASQWHFKTEMHYQLLLHFNIFIFWFTNHSRLYIFKMTNFSWHDFSFLMVSSVQLYSKRYVLWVSSHGSVSLLL